MRIDTIIFILSSIIGAIYEDYYKAFLTWKQ